MDRSDDFRKAAADRVALARITIDPKTRASLLTMAQKWYDLANGPSTRFRRPTDGQTLGKPSPSGFRRPLPYD
jgi:hypothetical protein